MLTKAYQIFLTLTGHKPEWTDRRHPLSRAKVHYGRDPEQIKRRIHKQAVIQQHIEAYRERLDNTNELQREGRELAATLAAMQMKQHEAERRLDSTIEQIALLVDRRLYEAGL